MSSYFDFILVTIIMGAVIALYFKNNPLKHSKKFMFRRFVNWFPLGMTYAFLYMARYNLNVSKNAFGTMMSKEDFGIIFGVGTAVYGFSFLINGPLVDKIGGKKGMLIASAGSCVINVLMGLLTYAILQGLVHVNMTLWFSVLYGMNMFFQSYGAVSIIKIKSYWFHVRERGTFGAIFGTLISFGVYFAYDWGQAIADAARLHISGDLTPFQRFFRSTFSIGSGTTDAIWLVFFIPAAILILWIIIDFLILKDTPKEANFEDFDTHDASSGEMHENFTMLDLLKKIFTSPVMLTIAAVEFTAGVIRNGLLQWYPVFVREVPQPSAVFFKDHWGLLICLTGVAGGFAAGMISDKLFHSRRGPPAAILNGVMLGLTIVMSLLLLSSPISVGVCALLISTAVIGVHAIMSGTAASDFGGRKATATAAGITDGFVYLGSSIQSVGVGYLTTNHGWSLWPVFLIPFTLLGFLFAIRIWKSLPPATKKYLHSVENVDI